MTSPRLTPTQASALERLSPTRWQGAMESDVQGSTLEALARKGLVVAAAVDRPHRRVVGRLTAAGVKLRRQRRLDELAARPLESLSTDRLVELWAGDVIDGETLDHHLADRARAQDAEHRAVYLEAALLDTLEQASGDAEWLTGYLEGFDRDEVDAALALLERREVAQQGADGEWSVRWRVEQVAGVEA